MAPEPGSSGPPFALAAWTRPVLRPAAPQAAAPPVVKGIQSASCVRRLRRRTALSLGAV